ncbi:MAG: tripartite tricarboxylate transporter substrate binding protein [Proteobacteria bacterium]|nr:tripartite tricarboxylate transporter substrate binding protein [Pseudomonadota bacterium]
MRLGRALLSALVLIALPTVLSGAQAADWPTKPVRVVIPFGAGSATDIIPRIVFDEVGKELGQQFIIENRGGAGGTIGEAMVAKADPDGYTFLAASSAHAIAPALYSKLTYSPKDDFTGVGILGNVPSVMIISPSKGIKTLKDFVAQAKAHPNKFTFATLGVGSAVYLAAERFRLSAGYEALNVPFKGGAEALTEIIAGRVDYYFCPIATALPYIKEGKLLALAVSSPTRAPLLPDVPTTEELGFHDSASAFWIGAFALAKTDKAIVEKLNAAIAKAVTNPDVKAKLAKIGADTPPMSAAAFEKQVQTDFATYAEFAKKTGMKLN